MELNADVGELPGEAGRLTDRQILSVVSAANIACGAHAGDDGTMEATLRLCRELGVVPAAHPGYPDREGFGRRRGSLSGDQIRASVAAQLGRFGEIAARLGMAPGRVKAHGALYNEASFDRPVAEALLSGVFDAMPGATLLGLAGSPFLDWARAAGFGFLSEGFADRGYRADGTLVPRSEPGALIHGADEVAVRAVRLALESKLTAVDGSEIDLHVETLCLHGDLPGSRERAMAVRAALERAGVVVGPVSS